MFTIQELEAAINKSITNGQAQEYCIPADTSCLADVYAVMIIEKVECLPFESMTETQRSVFDRWKST